MKYLYGAAALFAASVSADLCAHGSTDDNGNYYCQKVNAITYTGVGGSGSYNKVTAMDSSSGSCSSSPHSYSGSLAPLDEEVSVHVRGPTKLKKFAFYAPSSSSSESSKLKPKARRSAHERRHSHGHNHVHLHKKHEHNLEERAVGDMVTANINGVEETWVNDYSGVSSSASSASGMPTANTPAGYGSGSGSSDSSSSSSTGASPASYSSSSSSNDGFIGGSGWTRQAYYDSEAGSADGLVFLNHEGGSGSGTFDYSFGNSLSYASKDGASGSSSPQTLEDCTLASSSEVVIMTDSKCSDDGGCGFYRDGTVAYHGFDGPSKAFFFEFSMPDDGQSGASIYDAVNMPALWLLNAQIPRTLQYGKSECSCWESGCGEFDVFEVLAAGDTRAKSTLHGNVAGGDSDYFERPTSDTIKVGLILNNDKIHIKVLDDSSDFDFGSTMGDTFVDDICADTLQDSLENLVSVFALSS